MSRVLRRHEVAEMLGINAITVWRMARANQFPKPILIGQSRAIGWLAHEVEEWIEQRAAAREMPRAAAREMPRAAPRQPARRAAVRAK